MDLTDRWAKGKCTSLALKDSKRYDKVFFIGSGRPRSNPEHEGYCGACPIQYFCLSYALIYDELGVWGNTTKSQRDHLVGSTPDLIPHLIEEAKNQGWYSPKPRLEEFLPSTRQLRDSGDLEQFADTSLEELDMPEDLLLADAQLPLPRSDQSNNSSEHLFGFPSPSLDRC